MAKKEAVGRYQIGDWSVEREGRIWRAESRGICGWLCLKFGTLAAAHLHLTGEPMRESHKH